MKIGRAQVEALATYALEGYPFEVCGVLLGDSPGRVDRVEPVQNREIVAPRVRYQIAPEDLLRIQRQADIHGEQILGFYHSHPDHPARPSETDRRIAAEGLSDGVLHLVVGVEAGRRALPSAWIFHEAGQGFVEESLEIE